MENVCVFHEKCSKSLEEITDKINNHATEITVVCKKHSILHDQVVSLEHKIYEIEKGQGELDKNQAVAIVNMNKVCEEISNLTQELKAFANAQNSRIDEVNKANEEKMGDVILKQARADGKLEGISSDVNDIKKYIGWAVKTLIVATVVIIWWVIRAYIASGLNLPFI